MKVKRGLKDFIKKNMEFMVQPSGIKCLDVLPERLMLMTSKEISYAARLNEIYQSRACSRVKLYPDLVPGIVVELVCGEKYLIVSNPTNIHFDDTISYKMIGLSDTLDTCMYGPDLKQKPYYAKLSSKLRDISKVYRINNYSPGMSILLTEEPNSSYSLVEIWKR